MTTAWIDSTRHDRDVLASALEAAGFIVNDDEDADVRIGDTGAEVGDWWFDIPDSPIAVAWFITGWLARDDADYDEDE